MNNSEQNNIKVSYRDFVLALNRINSIIYETDLNQEEISNIIINCYKDDLITIFNYKR